MNTEQTTVADAIFLGQHDSDLDAIYNAVRERRQYLADGNKAKTFRELQVGDTVRFNHKVRPAYLQGMKARVVRKNRVKVVVRLLPAPGQDVGRFYGDVTTSTAIIERCE